MQVKISARDITVSPSVDEYIRSKAEKLLKYSVKVQEIRVVASLKNKLATVEMIVDVEHGEDLIAEVSSEDLMASTDMVVDKLAAQMQKAAGKLKDHQHAAVSGKPN